MKGTIAFSVTSVCSGFTGIVLTVKMTMVLQSSGCAKTALRYDNVILPFLIHVCGCGGMMIGWCACLVWVEQQCYGGEVKYMYLLNELMILICNGRSTLKRQAHTMPFGGLPLP